MIQKIAFSSSCSRSGKVQCQRATFPPPSKIKFRIISSRILSLPYSSARVYASWKNERKEGKQVGLNFTPRSRYYSVRKLKIRGTKFTPRSFFPPGVDFNLKIKFEENGNESRSRRVNVNVGRFETRNKNWTTSEERGEW